MARALEGRRRSGATKLENGERTEEETGTTRAETRRTETRGVTGEREGESGGSAREHEYEYERERCPECGGDVRRASERAESVCEECGLIVAEEGIDRGPEWRAFDQRERESRSRVGAPLTETLHDKGLSTTIDWRDTDAHGNALAPEKRARIERLRRWQGRIRTAGTGERTLRAALSEIDRMASALGVPGSVREVAGALQRRAGKADLLRGRSVEGVASAVLYAACRLEGVPRSLDEITGVSRVERKEIGRAYRYLVRELELQMEPTDPKAYVSRYCSDLDLPEVVRAKAIELLDAAGEKGLLSGRSPTGSAAAAVYAAGLLCEEKRSQSAVADVAEITEVTIRNRYREHLEAIGVFEGL